MCGTFRFSTEIFKNTFFTEHLWRTASIIWLSYLQKSDAIIRFTKTKKEFWAIALSCNLRWPWGVTFSSAFFISLQQFFTSLQHLFTSLQHSFYFPSPLFTSLHNFFTFLHHFFYFASDVFFTPLHRFYYFSSDLFLLPFSICFLLSFIILLLLFTIFYSSSACFFNPLHRFLYFSLVFFFFLLDFSSFKLPFWNTFERKIKMICFVIKAQTDQKRYRKIQRQLWCEWGKGFYKRFIIFLFQQVLFTSFIWGVLFWLL